MTSTSAAPHSRGRLLLIDDDETFVRVLRAQLTERGYDVSYVLDGRQALGSFEGLAPEVVVVDLATPGIGGLAMVSALHKQDETVGIIVLSGDVDVPTTVKALRAGAEDVHTKPVAIDLLCAAIERGLARSRLQRAHRVATTQVSDPYGLLDASPAMQRVLRMIQGLSRSVAPVLLIGEPGTGKHAVAEAMHQMSPAAGGPFHRHNCGAREHDLEAALLGSQVPPRRGLLEVTHGGTLVLEDIGELSEGAQELLLAVLTRAPLGRRLPQAASVRVIITTERDLADEVRAGRLRPDLYQQLSALPVMVPSLRSRGEAALTVLAGRIVQRNRSQYGRGPERCSEEALRCIVAEDWPGNVRQLRQVLEDAFFLALDDDVLDARHLMTVLERTGTAEPSASSGDMTLAQAERRQVAKVLARSGGNRSEAARLLGITRTTLYKKMQEYGLERVGTD